MKKTLFAIASCAVLGLSSCSMNDINVNPNAAPSATNDYLMPTAEMNLAATVGVGFNMLGGYNAEVYGQNAGCTNYLKYSQFEVTATNSSSSYAQLYSRVLETLKIIKDQSAKAPGSALAAATLRAYTLQMLVDAYGETPCSEALDDSNQQPKYDDGADVYKSIIEELETAISNVSGNEVVCANLTFGKKSASQTSVSPWIPFAKSVLLKLYMRESAVVDNKAKIKALVEEGDFIKEDVVYSECFGNAAGSYNPLYQESKTISSDLVLNYAVTATYAAESSNDTRLSALWKNGSAGMIGTVSGTNLSAEMPSAKTSTFSAPNYSFNMPVYLMTVAEVKFFIAEYYSTMEVDPTKAADAYKSALKASCATCNANADVVNDIMNAYPYDAANPMKNIGIQKWMHFAATLQGFEAWCELRRVKYPAFSDQTAEAIIASDLSNLNVEPSFYTPGTIYTPKNVYAPVGSKKLRQRFDYASSSAQYNNNSPATKEPTVPVFWNK